MPIFESPRPINPEEFVEEIKGGWKAPFSGLF
jgi:hypothetical protein